MENEEVSVTGGGVLSYKGYTGDYTMSLRDKCIYGYLSNVKGVYTFVGDTAIKAVENFKQVVEDYIHSQESCITSDVVSIKDNILTYRGCTCELEVEWRNSYIEVEFRLPSGKLVGYTESSIADAVNIFKSRIDACFESES